MTAYPPLYFFKLSVWRRVEDPQKVVEVSPTIWTEPKSDAFRKGA